MSEEKKIARRKIPFALLFVFLNWVSCAGVGSLADAGGDASSTELDAGGPVDLPVTIAKLEAPDALNVAVEYASAAELDRALNASDSRTATFTGSGDAADESGRAIHDPNATPFVLLYNHDTDAQTVAAVGTDGSFSASIAADTGESVGLFAVTTDELDAATSSPGVFYVVDSVGTITVTVSNIETIDDDMPFSITPDGGVLFSIEADDGTRELWRRNVDGSLPDRLLTGHEEAFLISASVSDPETADSQSTLLLDRGADLFLRPSSAEGDTIGDWGVLIDGVGVIADENDNRLTRDYILQAFDTDTVLVKAPVADGATFRLDTVNLDGTRQSILDGALAVENLFFTHKGDDGGMYVTYKETASSRTFVFRLEIAVSASDIATAWQNRVAIVETIDYEILDIANDNGGNAVLLTRDAVSGTKKLRRVSPEGVMVVFTDLSLQSVVLAERLVAPRLVSGGTGIIACDEGVDGVAKRLLYYPLEDVTVDAAMSYQIEPRVLVANDDLRSCRHFDFTPVGDSGLAHFFTAASESGSSQLSFVILDRNDAVED